MSYRIFINFLSPSDCDSLLSFGEEADWSTGRQETGYLKAVIPSGKCEAVKNRALHLLGGNQLGNDAYLLRYPVGSHIPPHLNDAPFGTEHWRLNAVVRSSEAGGVFGIEERNIDLLQGDAIIFRPDKFKHRVSKVYGHFDRIVLSIGTLKG
jgi:hypothetical protein